MLRERIDLLCSVRRVEERLGPNLEVGMRREHLLDLVRHRQVVGAGEQRERPPPHFRNRVPEQATDGGVNGAVVRHLEEAEGVNDCGWLLPPSLRRQHVGGGAEIEHRGSIALGVEPVLVNAVLQVLDVPPPGNGGSCNPPGKEQEADPRRLDRAPAEGRGEDEHRKATKAMPIRSRPWRSTATSAKMSTAEDRKYNSSIVALSME